jgi:hypothetical protein
MSIPKFCALCEDDLDVIYFCGTGDTPDEAFKDFMNNGSFEEQCRYWPNMPGDMVDVNIYSVMPYEDSEWPRYDETQNFEWCLNKKIETRRCEAI